MARLDRDPPEYDSGYANTGQVTAGDRAVLESATGRLPPTEEGASEIQDDEIRAKSGGGRPLSDETNFHLSGTGAIETEDGLDETEEMLRQEIEDVLEVDAPEEGTEDIPIFDRAEHA